MIIVVVTELTYLIGGKNEICEEFIKNIFHNMDITI